MKSQRLKRRQLKKAEDKLSSLCNPLKDYVSEHAKASYSAITNTDELYGVYIKVHNQWKAYVDKCNRNGKIAITLKYDAVTKQYAEILHDKKFSIWLTYLTKLLKEDQFNIDNISWGINQEGKIDIMKIKSKFFLPNYEGQVYDNDWNNIYVTGVQNAAIYITSKITK